MQETITAVTGLLEANNGTMPYKDLYDQLPYEHRGRLQSALAQLKADNVARQQVAFDAETKSVSHNVYLVGA